MVSRSRGSLGCSREGGTGSWFRTISTVSMVVSTQERWPAGEQLVEDRAERVDVRGRPDLLMSGRRLLRGHVAGRADDDAARRQIAGQIEPLHQAEVGDLGLVANRFIRAQGDRAGAVTAGQQDVRGFEIAMNNAELVGRVHGAGKDFHHLRSLARGQRLAALLRPRLSSARYSRAKKGRPWASPTSWT